MRSRRPASQQRMQVRAAAGAARSEGAGAVVVSLALRRSARRFAAGWDAVAVSSAGAGSVWISLALRRSTRRLAGRDRLSFAGPSAAAAFGAAFAAVGAAAAPLFRPAPAFAGGALRTGEGPSRCACGSAELAAELPAAALIGWDFARRALLTRTGLGHGQAFPVDPGREARSRFGHNRSLPDCDAIRTFGQKNVLRDSREERRSRPSRITLAGLLALARLVASGRKLMPSSRTAS